MHACVCLVPLRAGPDGTFHELLAACDVEHPVAIKRYADVMAEFGSLDSYEACFPPREQDSGECGRGVRASGIVPRVANDDRHVYLRTAHLLRLLRRGHGCIQRPQRQPTTQHHSAASAGRRQRALHLPEHGGGKSCRRSQPASSACSCIMCAMLSAALWPRCTTAHLPAPVEELTPLQASKVCA
jgi:hypothetical protein